MSFGFATSTSMIGGLLDSIIKPFQDLFNILITAIQYGICALLYTLQVGMFWIIDMVQSVFRRVAGLEPYWYKQDSGNITSQDGDIVESFLHSDLVWNIFTSVLIAAIILLFVTTIMAILKTEVNEKDNAKGPVFKQALKAIAYFAIVPVVCLFGVSLANIFLRSFDKVTSVDGATSISGQVFAAASYNSNRVRNGQQLAGDDSKYSKAIKRLMGVRYTENGTTKQTLNIKESSGQEEVANAIDSAFINGYIITIEENNVVYDYSDKSSYMAGYGYLTGSKQESFKTFDKTATSLVYYYYDLLSYNYLIGYLASFTIIMLLLNLMIGVVQRLFDLTILFIVSPAFIATMPLDEGSRYKKWREKFVEKTLACYGPIVGINLAFTILTLVQRIYIFDPAGGDMNGLFNALMQCIFVIVAILCVKDFGKLVNGLVGGNDLNDNKAKEVVELGSKLAAGAVHAGSAGLKLGAAAVKTPAQLVQNFSDKKRKNAEDEQKMQEIKAKHDATRTAIESSTKLGPEGKKLALKALDDQTDAAIAKQQIEHEANLAAIKKKRNADLKSGAKDITQAMTGGVEGMYKASGLSKYTKAFADADGTKALEDSAMTLGNMMVNTQKTITNKGLTTEFKVIDSADKEKGFNAKDAVKETRRFLGTSGQAKKDKEKQGAADAQKAQADAVKAAFGVGTDAIVEALSKIEAELKKPKP